MKRPGFAMPLVVFILVSVAECQQRSTLAVVRERGYLRCGIDRSEAEYSSTDEHGRRTAFDRDLCKAIALAALGPEAKAVVTFYADDGTSLSALMEGKADVIASLSSDAFHASSLGASAGIVFTAPVLHDPVSLMVSSAGGVARAQELSGKLVCLLSETKVQDAVQAWFAVRQLDLLPFPFQEEGEMEAAFVTGRCAAVAGDLTRLAETRQATGTRSRSYLILPEALGDDPLGTASRAGDAEWNALVGGTRDLLFCAERRGVTAHQIQAEAETPSGGSESLKDCSSLSRAQSAAVIAGVGNYAEIYARDLRPIVALRLVP